MTVAELIKALGVFDENLEVMVTWEGITRELDEEGVYLGADTWGGYHEAKKVVFIDGDDCHYKDRWQKALKELEDGIRETR